ncbi:DUF2059 domain-containing protein [Rhodobacterales bacterium HKCCSP123]|nr:DUF2059 domain-containing protein [Rhodobacterales bacterium HKCCSP123]
MPSRSILALPFLLAPLAVLPLAAPAQTNAEAQLVLPETRLSEEAPEVRAVFEAMGLYDILSVMSVEGLEGAPDIEADMFPGQGGSAWPAVVAGIYATDRMIAQFEAAIPLERMTPEIVAELQAFYDSDLGQRVAAGEVAGRQALLEPGVEEAARELARQQAAEGTERIALLTEFSAVNDFVERNVTGALNSNFAFYRGLGDGGAFETEIPEELMLAEVWGQEAEIRTETTEWLFGYQILAYEDLTDAEMARYIEMSESEAGQVLNAVLFQAFDVLFEEVSYDLGKAAASFIAGEET